MQLAVLGLNHKTVPVNIREQFSISPSGIHSGLHHLDTYDGIQEAVILSTCNRTEIYSVLGDGAAGAASLKNFFWIFPEIVRLKMPTFITIQTGNVSVIYLRFPPVWILWLLGKVRY